MAASAERSVAIARCGTYEDAAVAAALAAALEPLGGMRAFVKPGQRVCLKPNLLMKAVPERAVTTHPAVLRAVIREVKACGATRVMVGDSAAGRHGAESMRSAWETVGWTAVCAEEGADLVLFEDDVVRVPNPNSSLYASFNLARAAIEADVLIDLPKFKTHGFQQFTGAVKNLFGCIPGLEKAQFHLKVPDRDDFGGMLVDLMLACEPALAVMDGIVGMEGEGPGGGDPIMLGALFVSADCVALDVVASAVAGFDPMDVYTNKAANARGLGPKSADDVDVLGVPWREIAPASFKKPVRDISTKLPAGLARWLRKRIASRPYLARPAECTSCATCKQNCPVDAIEIRDKRPHFDYDRCIRCYCCQETCPPQAIGLKTPWLVRAVIAREEGRKA
jgi:uncharacterized protein (DUF362 family)/Pyruvate/2-oxoacid:ferredoxin oxidoreductase delta subunit